MFSVSVCCIFIKYPLIPHIFMTSAIKLSQANDQVIGIKIKSLPGNHTCFKKNKSQEQVEKIFVSESKIEYQEDQRSVYQIII